MILKCHKEIYSMNIKNILLFPLICITNINAITIGENIEKTKQAFSNCLKAKKSNCNQQKQAYEEAKKEIIPFLDEIEEKGKKAIRELNQDNKKSFFSNKMSNDEKKKLEQEKLNGYGASGTKEYLVGRSNNGHFEYYDGTINKFCDEALNEFVSNHCYKSSSISNQLFATQEEINETKKRMSRILKQLLNQESTLG